MKKKLLIGLAALTLLSGSALAMEKEQIIWTDTGLTCRESIVTYADTQELSQQDNDCLQVLYALDIMQGDGDGSFRPEDSITRAEMAKILVAAQYLPVTEFAESGFLDVPQTHWAKNCIAMAATQGLMVGDGDGNFHPEHAVTGAELCKVVTVLLGYAPAAETTGGYPEGYINTVKNYVVAEHAVRMPDTDAPATRLEVASLIYHALQAPLMEQTTFGAPENAEFAILDGSAGTEYVCLLKRSFFIEQK